MILSAIVTVPRTGGLVIPDTMLASLTIIQMSKAGFVPLTLTEIYQENPSPTSCRKWQINFVHWQSAINALVILSLIQRSPAPAHSGVGDRIRGSISTFTISTYLSASRVIKIVRSLISHH